MDINTLKRAKLIINNLIPEAFSYAFKSSLCIFSISEISEFILKLGNNNKITYWNIIF